MENLTRYKFNSPCVGSECECLMVPCEDGEYVKFSDIEELLQTSHNNRSDEIAWLEKVASYPKSIGENFHVGIILKRLAQLRTMR